MSRTRRVDELVQAMGPDWAAFRRATGCRSCCKGHRRTCRRVPEPARSPANGGGGLSLARRPPIWKVSPGRTGSYQFAAIIAVAANTEGRPLEIIGLGIGPSRGPRHSWTEFLRSLRVPAAWGGVRLVHQRTAHTGLQSRHRPGSSKQPGNAVASTGCVNARGP